MIGVPSRVLPCRLRMRYGSRDMKRSAVAVVALLLLAIASLAVMRSAGSFRSVYSVAEVRAGLAHNPHAWVGQIVLVRSVVIASGLPVGWQRAGTTLHPVGVLVDAGTQPPVLGLPLAFAPQDPVLSFLRSLPWLGRFAPGPQSLTKPGDQSAVYRVRIEVTPAGTCGRRPCYGALLLDSAPPMGTRLRR